MSKFPHTIWLFFLILPVWSCVRDEEEPPSPELVIEGWIEDGGYPVVYIGECRPPEESDEISLKDYVVRWGKVSISDGTRTIVLTGSYTSEKYRPYRYDSYDMKGEAGKTYYLEAEYRGRTVTAKTTIPVPVAIDSLRAVQSGNDTLYHVKAYFRDAPQTDDYYVLFSRRRHKDPGFLLSFMGVVSDEVTSEYVAADVYRGSSILSAMDKESTIYFSSGDTVQVKLCHTDRDSYLFWNSFSNLQNLSSNMFFPYTDNPESNVVGGKGYWCGYGSRTLTIVIP